VKFVRSSYPAEKSSFTWTPISGAEKSVHISLHIYKELIVPPEIDERYGLRPVPPENLSHDASFKKRTPFHSRKNLLLKHSVQVWNGWSLPLWSRPCGMVKNRKP
jgi:hypothetical protein